MIEDLGELNDKDQNLGNLGMYIVQSEAIFIWTNYKMYFSFQGSQKIYIQPIYMSIPFKKMHYFDFSNALNNTPFVWQPNSQPMC